MRTSYKQRSDIAKQVEDMRTLLAEHGTGSLLNKLMSQDPHIDLLRNLDYDHNSLVEAQHTLSSLQADREVVQAAMVQRAEPGSGFGAKRA